MILTNNSKRYLEDFVQKKIESLEKEKADNATKIRNKFRELVGDRPEEDKIYKLLLDKTNSQIEQHKAKYDKPLEEMYFMKSRFC